MTAELHLLPAPASIDRSGQGFRVDGATPIRVGDRPSDAVIRAARDLQAAIDELLGFTPPISPGERGSGGISLTVREDAGTDPQGYELRVDDSGVGLTGGSEAGLFYGVQTLIQIARCCGAAWPGLAIVDAPKLPVRGLMLDVSRGKVPTLATLIRLAETLAHYKVNHFQLYTEHTFRFPSHPEIGRDAGSLGAHDMLALDRVCRDHHIELVPNLQSIGHQAALLALPRYQHLAETPWNWTLATVDQASFELLDDLYGDLLPAFSSPGFNVNADEPWDLGRGRSAARAAEVGIGGVYLDHVRRLHQLVTERHGRRMMMWADMFWFHPELVTELPDDILFLEWWYEAKERYDSVEVLANAKRRFLVCPGTSSWTAFFPRLDNAAENILGFVQAGIGAGAEGMLLTDWGDNGHYQPFANSWYPYLWGAECAWSGGATARDDFDHAFDRLFLADGSGRVTAALRRLGETTQTDEAWLTTWNTAMAVFEEPIDGRLAQVTSPEVVRATAEAADALEPLLDTIRDPLIRHDLALVASLLAFGTEKVETSRAVRAALSQETPRLSELEAALKRMRSLQQGLRPLIANWEANWLATARPSEMRISRDRFARLERQFEHAIAWLEQQRSRLAAGEAPAPLSTYDRQGYAALWEETRDWVAELVAIIGVDALPEDLQGWFAEIGNER
jgi:hypothetical protein